MTTLYDLLGAHPDVDDETLKWVFRQALVKTRPDPRSGDADPLMQRIVGAGILGHPKQRLVLHRLIESERERLQAKSRRAGVSSALTTSFAILLGTMAGGYGLLAPDGADLADLADLAAGEPASQAAAAVIKRDDDIPFAATGAGGAAGTLPARPAIQSDVETPAATVVPPADAAKGDDRTPAPGRSMTQKADDVPAPAALPVEKAGEAPAAVPPVAGKPDDVSPLDAPAPAVKADDSAALLAAPRPADAANTADDALAAPAVQKADEARAPTAGEADDAPVVPAAKKAAEAPIMPAPPATNAGGTPDPALSPARGSGDAVAAAAPVEADQTAGKGAAEGLGKPAATLSGDRLALRSPATEAAPFRNDARYYRERGFASYRRGDFQQAAADLDEAVRLSPDDALARNLRGNIADEIGASDRALTDYDEAIRLEPDNIALLDDRAVLWHRRGDAEKALADLDRAIRSSLADAKVYCDRGLILYGRGSVDRATADFSQAFRLDSNFAAAYIRRGALLHRYSEFNAVLAAVYPAIRVDSKTLDASRRSIRRPVPPPAAPPLPPNAPIGPDSARARPAEIP